MDTKHGIRLENVSKHFRKGSDVVRALDGIALEVPGGALATVRGPSGSGKTTLINLVAGLMRPTSGAVFVAGERLDGLSPAQRAALRARRIAVVFQMFHLVPYLTTIENVLLPTLAAPAAPGENLAERAQSMIAALGIEHRTGHFPDELSVGERQRCAVARALLHRPEVVLADEPTGNLDPDSARRVLEALDTCRAEGATVLLVTHHPVDSIHPDIEFRLENGVLSG
ncbi:MAG: ATP-binding cassette domain-containing protein [Candidatus Hydrogenedentes bacterium]|nr:ATP-binding cassette domain-containing protein [Candidatus Hydrogenedentota bacterium]